MHDRISVNNLCFPASSLEEDVAAWQALGARQIGVVSAKMLEEGWDSAIGLIQATGLPVATVVHPFMMPGTLDDPDAVHRSQLRLLETIEGAGRLGAKTIYMITGGRGSLGWNEAVAAFTEAVGPCRDRARDLDVALLVEPAPALYADLHIAHSLRDTLALAEAAEIGVCIDIFSCWTEAGLDETIRRAAHRSHLVQVSDWVPGDRALPCRAVPGDGVIPLRRIIGTLLDAGFGGAFDLELIGPRIDREGHRAAVARTCDRLGELLAGLGA